VDLGVGVSPRGAGGCARQTELASLREFATSCAYVTEASDSPHTHSDGMHSSAAAVLIERPLIRSRETK
jgi:hypothetical protein